MPIPATTAALLLPTVLPCFDGGYLTWILVQMITFANFAWFSVSGFAFASPQPFIIYLSIVYWEEIFINYTLYGFFTFGWSVAQLNELNVMCSTTNLSVPIPSLPYQLTITLTTFIMIHIYIRYRKLIPNKAIFAYIILLNVIIPFALIYTGNATVTQIFFALGLGVVNALRRVLFFEYYFVVVWERFVEEWKSDSSRPTI